MARKTQQVKSDHDVNQVRDVLEAAYKSKHPRAEVSVRRENPVAIHIRIIDPDFKGTNRVERDDDVWEIIETLPEKTLSQITILLLVTPEETAKSLGNFAFEHPIPSRL